MLLIGPPGSGKTSLVLQALEEAIREGKTTEVRLIVPTASMAQHLMHTLARRGWMTPGGLVQTVAELVRDLTPDLREPTPAGASRLLQRAIAAAAREEFTVLADTPGLRAKLATVIEEFEAAGVNADSLAPLAVSNYQQAFCAVFREYENLVSQNEFTSPPARLRRAAEAVLRNEKAPARRMYLDGFLNFSEPQKELVRALAEKVESVLVTVPEGLEEPFPEMPQQRLRTVMRPAVKARVFRATAPEKEAEEIARRIIEEGRPFHEYGVIVRSPEVYAPVFQTVFERFGIPQRFRVADSVIRHGAIQYFLGLLRTAAAGFPGKETLEVLLHPNSPVAGLQQIDRFDFRVRKKLPGEGMEFLREAADGFGAILEFLDRIETIHCWAEERCSPLQWADRCCQVSADYLGLPNLTDGMSAERVLELRRLARAISSFRQGCGEAADLLALDQTEECSLPEFLDALEQALAHTLLQVSDQRRNVVNVLTVFEARQWELPVVFVCGLVEGQFPRHYSQDTLFPDADRLRLRGRGMRLRTTPERDTEERMLFETATTRATEKLVLSYSERDDREQPLLRSFFLTSPAEDDADVPTVHVREKAPPFRRERTGRLQRPDVLDLVSRKHGYFRPSGLENYLQCPYQFFARHTLRLDEWPAEPELRLDPRLTGTIVHRVIALWSQGRSRPIGEVFEEVVEDERRKNSIRDGFQMAVIDNNMKADLERFAAAERAQPLLGGEQRFEEVVEYVIDDSHDPPAQIRGRIDRYEVFGEQLGFLIDYKYSSEARVDQLIKEHEAGTKVQAQLYLLGLERERGLRPAGMRFWGLRKGSATRGWVVPELLPASHVVDKDKRLNEVAFRAMLAAAAERTIEAISEIRAGSIEVRPSDRAVCRRNCEMRDICRIEL